MFSKSKGGSAKKKIREGKTRITLQEGDVVDIAAVKQNLEQVRGKFNTTNAQNNTEEQMALEEEALEFLLENEEREKKTATAGSPDHKKQRKSLS